METAEILPTKFRSTNKCGIAISQILVVCFLVYYDLLMHCTRDNKRMNYSYPLFFVCECVLWCSGSIPLVVSWSPSCTDLLPNQTSQYYSQHNQLQMVFGWARNVQYQWLCLIPIEVRLCGLLYANRVGKKAFPLPVGLRPNY